MNITVNGEPRDMNENTTVADLVDALDLVGKRIAVEINEELVPRSTFADHPIREGDHIEIVHAIGGG